MAVSSKPPGPQKPQLPVQQAPFFCRETRIPLEQLRGVERSTLDDIRACDPSFAGTSWSIDKLLFLDTETTGLSGGAGTVAFEIGLGFIEHNQMVIRQYVMRDYGEEAAMLQEIASLLQRFDTLVTFNGKTFDLPLLESRMTMHRLRVPVTGYPHLDLLHACRRVYKLRLKRCNLASLEEAVLGKPRQDDLPGAQVPERYFTYVKTREFALLEDVLRHNLQDVASLAELTGHLCSVFRNPHQLQYSEDLLGVGRTFERGGRTQQARKCYKILGHSSLSPQAHMYLSASYKRDRAWQEAVHTWQAMISRGEGGAWPYIELAKYYEHTAKDIPRALSCAKSALAYELNASLLSGTDEAQTAALRRRIERLTKKYSRLSKR